MKKTYTFDCDTFHQDGTPADSFCSLVTVPERADDPSTERLEAFAVAYSQTAASYIRENATIPGRIEVSLVNEGAEDCPIEEIRPVFIGTLDAIRADLADTADETGKRLATA